MNGTLLQDWERAKWRQLELARLRSSGQASQAELDAAQAAAVEAWRIVLIASLGVGGAIESELKAWRGSL